MRGRVERVEGHHLDAGAELLELVGRRLGLVGSADGQHHTLGRGPRPGAGRWPARSRRFRRGRGPTEVLRGRPAWGSVRVRDGERQGESSAPVPIRGGHDRAGAKSGCVRPRCARTWWTRLPCGDARGAGGGGRAPRTRLRSGFRTALQAVALAVAALVGIVLRWWNLGGPVATIDESFTGCTRTCPSGDPGRPAGRRRPPAARLPDAALLRRHRRHAALQVPSAVFGCATVLAVRGLDVASRLVRGGGGGTHQPVPLPAAVRPRGTDVQVGHPLRHRGRGVERGLAAPGGPVRARWLVGAALVVACSTCPPACCWPAP